MNVINHLIFKDKKLNNNNIQNISKIIEDENESSFSFQMNKNKRRKSNNTYNKKYIKNILKSNSIYIYNLNSLNNKERNSNNFLFNKFSNNSIINLMKKNIYNNIIKYNTNENINKKLIRKSVIINNKDQMIRKYSKKYKTIIDFLLDTQQKLYFNFFEFLIPVKFYKYNKTIFYYVALKEILLNNISVENIYKNSQFYKEYKNIFEEDNNNIIEKNNCNINNNLFNNNYESNKI